MGEIAERIKAELWKGMEPPFPLADHVPKACLARHVATYRLEDIKFSWLAQWMGLVPYWLEYPDDKFVTVNSTKNDLWRLRLFHGKYGDNGKKVSKLEKIAILNPEQWENRRIREMITSQGESLVDFHHRIRNEFFPLEIANNVADLSPWLKSLGGKASNYYAAMLSLFVVNGVLFEDFDSPFSDKEEAIKQLEKFKQKIFIPAWQKVVEITGLEPIIVCLPSTNVLSWYPGAIKEKINDFCPLGC